MIPVVEPGVECDQHLLVKLGYDLFKLGERWRILQSSPERGEYDARLWLQNIIPSKEDGWFTPYGSPVEIAMTSNYFAKHFEVVNNPLTKS